MLSHPAGEKYKVQISLEHISCDFCGCKDYKIRYRKPDAWLWPNQFEYPVVECINCGLVYINPRPTQESMRYFYPDNFHKEKHGGENPERLLSQTNFLPKLSSETVLDIGCGQGDFLNFLKSKYPDTSLYGVDYFVKDINSKNIQFFNKLLADCHFEDNYFDLITAWAVFEHLHSPDVYFNEVSRILKKEGKFIFLVTNSESLYGKYAYIEDIPRHTYHFSKKTLQNYAKKYNFKMTKCIFTDEIFDGRGKGTFNHLFSKIAGISWQKIYFKDINILQKIIRGSGRILDKMIFKTHWESKIGISGNMVVEFEK